jgi:hypothetical protein
LHDVPPQPEVEYVPGEHPAEHPDVASNSQVVELQISCRVPRLQLHRTSRGVPATHEPSPVQLPVSTHVQVALQICALSPQFPHGAIRVDSGAHTPGGGHVEASSHWHVVLQSWDFDTQLPHGSVRCVPALHTPSPAQAVTGTQEQASLQVSVRFPQFPHVPSRCVPGAQAVALAVQAPVATH